MAAVYGGLHESLSQQCAWGLSGADSGRWDARRFARRELRYFFQVFFEIVMVGNLAEKSFALAATVMAILRATAL